MSILIKEARTAIKAEARRQYTPSHFGVHVTLDGYQGDIKPLDSMEQVFAALDVLPEKLGMHKIMTPYVVRVPGNDLKDPGGVSGFVMIAESHISIHTFPGRKFVSIDVYTCQDVLDTDTIFSYFTKTFRLQKIETHVIRRGRYFQKLAPLA
jgi:S-adenosylmethionine decarboxylase